MKRVFRLISITLVCLFVSGIALLFLLPKPPLLQGISSSTAVYDQNHHLLRLTLSKDDKYRLYTPLAEISPELIATTLVQEDQYFWNHYGINPWSILKAAWGTYIQKTRRMGASTITMQTARLRYGIHSKNIQGKLLQIFRAMQLEIHYSKAQILEAYLNLAPYGNNIEGVGAASLIYFDKRAKDTTLPEALTLSVIPQNPSKRTPKNKKLNQIRQRLFLRWVELHPEDKAKKNYIELPLAMRKISSLPFEAPHLVNEVLHKLLSSQTVVTTLDLPLQKTLQRVMQQYLKRKKNIGALNAAIMLVDVRDMSIKTSIGSADFYQQKIQGQINGTQIKRSPGSTLKPFIYGLALDQGLIHPRTVLKDVPRSFGAYNPENFDYDFMGPITAHDALILSRNIPAIYLTSQLHPTLYELLEKAEVSQLKPPSYYGLSLALGGAELTMQELVGLYAMLLNEGIWHPVRLKNEEPLTSGKKLLSREASFLVLDMLKDTAHPYSSQINFPVAWKTGTSSGFRDAWTIGIFGPYVLGVWVGNFNNQSNPAFVGKDLAAPLFFELIDAIKQTKKSLPIMLTQPSTLHLEKIEICKASGLLPTRYCQEKELTWFIPGKSPIKRDNIYREIAINKNTGLRTCHFNENTHFEIYEFWPTDLLKVFKQAGIQKRIPPPYEEGCSLTNNTGISPQISSPQAEITYIVQAKTSQPTLIPFTVVTDADIAHVYWFVDNTYIGEINPQKPLFWNAKPGHFVVRVVDDHGLSDAHEMTIQVAG